MPGRREFLKAFYAKYAPDQQLSDERLNAIDQKYSDDNLLIKDLYAKYAPKEEVNDERISAITQKYQLGSKPERKAIPAELQFNPKDDLIQQQDETVKPVFEQPKEELKHELKKFEGSTDRIASGDFTEKDIEVFDAYKTKFVDKNKDNKLVQAASDIATKKKEYDDLFTQKETELKDAVSAFQEKRVAELQKLVKTDADVDKYNNLLKEETEALIKQKETELNVELEPKFKELQKSLNNPFADPNYRKGYQEASNRNVSQLEKIVTGEYLDRIVPGESFSDFRKSLVSTITDQLPGGVASGVAGTMTVDFDEYIVAQHSTFNKGDYWNPEKALENRKKVERKKYIRKVGVDQYEKEKQEWESKRLEEKQKLLNYSTQQEGEGEASSPHLTWEEAKLQGKKLNYVAKNVGQVLGLAVPTIAASAINPNLGAAVGFSAMSLMEKGEAYKEGLALLEQKTGLSQEEIFKTNADALLRDSSTQSGLINGLLEYVGQVATVGKFIPKNQLVNLLDKFVKNRAAKVTIGSITEGLTEWMQSKDTHYAAAIGEGKSHSEAIKYAFEQDDSESFIAGLSGGGLLSGISETKDFISTRINKKAEKNKLNVEQPEGTTTPQTISEPVQQLTEEQVQPASPQAVQQGADATGSVNAAESNAVLEENDKLQTQSLENEQPTETGLDNGGTEEREKVVPKVGDIVSVGGRKVEIISYGKTKGGNDQVTYRVKDEKTKEEIEQQAAETVWARTRKEHGGKASIEQIKKDYPGAVSTEVTNIQNTLSTTKGQEISIPLSDFEIDTQDTTGEPSVTQSESKSPEGQVQEEQVISQGTEADVSSEPESTLGQYQKRNGKWFFADQDGALQPVIDLNKKPVSKDTNAELADLKKVREDIATQAKSQLESDLRNIIPKPDAFNPVTNEEIISKLPIANARKFNKAQKNIIIQKRKLDKLFDCLKNG